MGASVRLRGPEGYYVRAQITYGGQKYSHEKLVPLNFLGEGGDSLDFPVDWPLTICVVIRALRPGDCNSLLIDLLEVRYVPTFFSSVPLQPFQALSHGSALADI